MFDFKKLLKYIIFLTILYLTIIFVTKSKIDNSDNLTIALVGTVLFAILDQYAPSYIIKEKDVKV
jgi:hypothetical protein